MKEDEGIAQSGSSVEKLAKSSVVKEYVDACWPAVKATDLVRTVLADPPAGVLGDEDVALLQTSGTKCTRADLPLLDEAAWLIERQPGFAHVILDEAQDLSPMQLRVVGRRALAGSLTVLGDQAQATTPWAVGDWRQVLEHLGKPDGTVQALTLGYRVPREVLDLANRLLPTIAPSLPPADSLRHVVGAVSYADSAAAAVDRLRGKGTIAIIVPSALTETIPDAVALTEDGLAAPITVVRAADVKGLEFDHVVLVDPDALPLRVLYVAMTRAVTSLTIVGSLPPELR
jgi:hypothetical protein